MTGAHEQAGLRKPSNRTSEVRAIDSEDLKILPIQVSNPAGDIRGITIPGIDHGIAVCGQASLAGGKLIHLAQGKPRFITELSGMTHRGQYVTHDGHGQNHADNSIEQNSQLHEKTSPGEGVRHTHWISPFEWKAVEYGWPGSFGRKEASHAATSETSSGDIGLPGTSARQSGAPRSGRPT